MTYQIKKIDKFRNRRVFSYFPIIIVAGRITWTGHWFKYITIQEQKIKIRYRVFDDAYISYGFYKTKWTKKWIFNKII